MKKEIGIEILMDLFNEKKFMNAGNLTAIYDRKELDSLLDSGVHMLIGIETAIVTNQTDRIGFRSHFEAFGCKVFIESQMVFVFRAIKFLESNIECTTMEGNSFDFEISLN